MPIKGKIEVFSRRVVTGWLAVFGNYLEKPALELLLDGKAIAVATADEPRPDVGARGFGDGRCQFQITLPEALTDDEASRLQLRIANSDVFLELPRPAGRPDGHASEPGSSLASPVFIAGSPRSGTSVLTRALANVGYSGFEEGNLLGLSHMVDRSVDIYFESNDAASQATLLGNVNRLALKERLFAVFQETLDHLNPLDPWFDKTGNPETILMLPRIMQTWPTSRVIFARRRGIENVESRLVKFPERDFAYHCRDWASNMQTWRTTREHLNPTRIAEVDQREMLEAPEQVARRLVGLLNLGGDAEAEMTRTFRAERPQETFPGSAARVLSPEAAGWDGWQIETFEILCGTEMRAYDYD